MIDIVIIGGGIAGLYCAYKIKKMDPSKKILLLEASDRLGGRAGNVNFHGEQVAIGAGIGRKNKDKLLLSILKELNVQFHEFMASSQYASSIESSCKVKEMFLYLHLWTFKTPILNVLKLL
uniref:Amine oxidase domain-containing protein n=1 Tax=viral metagenome TaxID=1070528 RepID=A0A6C0LC71_9ZZZZ